MMSRKFLAV